MNTFSKKLVSTALTATTTVWATGALLLFPVANAQALDLNAQIQALLAQIAQLQAQLGTPQDSSMMSFNFTRSLTVGSTGDDVKALQQFLNSHGAQVSATGAGSPGNETNYFGQKTRTALAAYQASVGISPAIGYFGPITRAHVNGLMTEGPPLPPSGDVCLNIEGTQTTVPAGLTRDSSGNCVVASIPGSGLTVSVGSDNPVGGSLIAGAGRTPVLALNLSAGSANGITVSDIKVKKNGVVSDNGISGAYVVGENGKVIAQYTSISLGVITFSNLGINVGAGQTQKVWIAIDPGAGLSAGNTVSFSVTSASDVTAWNASTAVTPVGTFPVNGNIFTVTTVSSPSLATLTVSSSSIGTTVDAGSQNVIVSSWTLNVGNSPITVSNLTLRAVGSANKADIQNLKLNIGGVQVATVARPDPGTDNVVFDLSGQTVKLATGNNTVQIYADIMGSPNRNVTFGFYDSFNINTIDTQYNTAVKATLNDTTSAQITINAGSLSVTLASDTPTGNVAKGGSNTPLLKAKFYAAGEALRIKHLTFRLSFNGGTVNLDNTIKNLSLTDDKGSQVGSTINSLMTDVTCTDVADSQATSTPINCFGNSSSPVNYVVPGNTAVVLTLKGDIQTTADFTSVVADFRAGSSNLVGTTSSNTASSGAVTGSSLTLAANSLTVAQNAAIGAQTVASGGKNVIIGSYKLTASTAEGVKLSSISIQTSGNSTTTQNMRVMSGGAQFGTTQSNMSASSTYAFSGNLTIAAGQTVVVDVVADYVSGLGAVTFTSPTTLSACTGQGLSTQTSISCTSTAGQNIVIAGQATLQVSFDNSAQAGSPAASQFVMGSTNNALAAFRLQESSNVEDLRITDLYVFDYVGSTSTAKNGTWSSLSLCQGTNCATAGSPTAASSSAAGASTAGPAYYYKFSFANPVTVPKNGSISLALKGDVSSYNSSGATDNSTHTFKFATSTDTTVSSTDKAIVAYGLTSNATATITLSSPGAANTHTVLRSKVIVTAAGLGATANRSKTANDDFGTITFTSDAAGAVAINSLTITFTGTAASSSVSSTLMDGIVLLDANGTNVTSTSGVTRTTSTSACNGTNSCSVTWNFGQTTAGWRIGQSGTSGSYTFKLRFKTDSNTGVSGVAQGLTATISAATDVTYTDGLDTAATSNISPPTNVAPIQIQSVGFLAGS